MIEHKLAHISQRQGNHARYVGVRKNTFDLRRASAIQIWKHCIGQRSIREKLRNDVTFKPFGVLVHCCKPAFRRCFGGGVA